MSERACQFYIRGRCQKEQEDCEFKHEKPEKMAMSAEAEKQEENDKSVEEVPATEAVAKKTVPADMTSQDTSTFIAATSDETMAKNQLMTRRVPDAEKEQEKPAKEIRRNSKGFENFDDYFDSDGNDTTINTEKAAEESVDNEEAFESSVPAPTETIPEDILENKNKKASLADLSKEWDEEPMDTNEQIQAAQAEVNAAQEQVQSEPVQEELSQVQAVQEPVEAEPQTVQNEQMSVEAAQEQVNAAQEQVQPDQEAEQMDQGQNEQVQTDQEPVQDPQAEQNEEQETIENIESFLGETKKKDEPVAKKEKGKEEWVTVIFGEDGKQITEKSKEKSVYDMEDEDFSATKATPFPGRKKSIVAKQEGVTRIGNNTFYYTGDKEAGEATPSGAETEEDEMEDRPEGEGLITGDDYEENFDEESSEIGSVVDDSAPSTPSGESPGKKAKQGRGYAQGRRKHNTNYVYGAKSTAAKTRRCGECEGCNREDCGKCPSCVDKPRFGGRGAKKQACIYRICTWKNPSGKRITPQTPNLATTPKGVPTGKIVSPAAVRRVTDGPKEPESPAPVEKANDDATPKKRTRGGAVRGRKSISVVSPALGAGEELNEHGQIVKKGDDEYIVIASGMKDTGLSGKYWSDMENLPARRRCTISPQPPQTSPSPTNTGTKRKAPEKPAEETPSKRGRKKQGEESEESTPQKSRKNSKNDENNPELTDNATENLAQENGDQEARQPQRNISCLSDTNATGNQQREVVVECFAPYDDHRWVNIGKEKNGMAPDAVQYARALRPPYQLLSFLRIKGNCAKGMGCSNKNTMVFVVLEGEITVVIHNTNFNAKKGDSFYIPPKNYYNLINNKAREAELSLLQYQYSGPLPSVPAGSQSGQTANGVQN